jgi:hypothetical protein
MAEYNSKDLIRFPNRISSIADIVAHNTAVVCRHRNHTPESLSELANIPLKDVLQVFDATKREAKLSVVFSLAHALRVSPETLLGFDQAEIGVSHH